MSRARFLPEAHGKRILLCPVYVSNWQLRHIKHCLTIRLHAARGSGVETQGLPSHTLREMVEEAWSHWVCVGGGDGRSPTRTSACVRLRLDTIA